MNCSPSVYLQRLYICSDNNFNKADISCATPTATDTLQVGLIGTTGGWSGVGPFPVNSWTRLLLLQQLLADTLDLLDPFGVRTPAQHRWRLAPTKYAPLPNVRGAGRSRAREKGQERGGRGNKGRYQKERERHNPREQDA